jgi:hypothetical protein
MSSDSVGRESRVFPAKSVDPYKPEIRPKSAYENKSKMKNERSMSECTLAVS